MDTTKGIVPSLRRKTIRGKEKNLTLLKKRNKKRRSIKTRTLQIYTMTKSTYLHRSYFKVLGIIGKRRSRIECMV